MGLNISLSLERERYIGLLFMDRFGRLFDLDAMNSLLWLRGDYSKIAEREAKGLTNNWGASWIIVESKGIVVEAKSNTPYDHYNFPVENTKKKPQKKSSRKKRHHFGFLDCNRYSE
ncbi:unnamed protein product [Rhizophagus irregularis]|nr:unnamed protein product [Rhizophagus irregularis]